MGLRHTISQSAGDIVSMLRTRVELFGVEFSLEKTRFLKLLGLAAIAMVFLLLASLVGTLLLIAFFWDTPHRLLAIGLTAAFYALIGLALVMTIIRHLKSSPLPFHATVQELARDADMFTGLARDDAQDGLNDRSKRRDRS